MRLTGVANHALDICGDENSPELAIDGAVGGGGNGLVDPHDGHPVPRLACVHQVVLSDDLSAARQLPCRRRLWQFLRHARTTVKHELPCESNDSCVCHSGQFTALCLKALQVHKCFILQGHLLCSDGHLDSPESNAYGVQALDKPCQALWNSTCKPKSFSVRSQSSACSSTYWMIRLLPARK